MTKNVLIIGVGYGLSASLARRFYKENMNIFLVARNIEKINKLTLEVNAKSFSCDVSKVSDVEKLFLDLDQFINSFDLVIYNPSLRIQGPINEFNPHEVKKSLDITCFGAFLVAHQATKRMLKQGNGAIFFTGASASLKGFSNSSVFAMGKFALRGLVQSLARELHPKNIHVGHFIIDGIIKKNQINFDEIFLDPDDIAETYFQIFKQNRSVWTSEIEVRPWTEKF